MSIWVRSQDKEILMKVDNINLGINVDTKEPNRLFTFVDGVTTSFTLGKYKSKERAIEVLDEVEKKINLINLGHDFGSPMIDLKNPTYIYQMPNEWGEI